MSNLKKNLSLFGLTMVAVGGAIGSGIFRTPGDIVANVHQPYLVLAVWLLGGLVALTGALTFAELGSMFPGAGGLYVYLKEAYKRFQSRGRKPAMCCTARPATGSCSTRQAITV